ncbi:MAG: Abi family protein [Proteobacteria bacterium]|nr:Abi family protein [Pseudomonadota bacterium]
MHPVTPRPFTKCATTHTEQVDLLRQRGMQVDDPAEAEFYLQHLNYYRLAAYWLPFEVDHASHKFRAGTRFSDVLNLYIFDRELRLLVLDAVERIEVSVRSQWAYQLAHLHGPHAHLDPKLACRDDRWQTNFAQLQSEVRRSDETFIRHLTSSYDEQLPPVWAVCEVMSLGLLSRWFDNLKPMATRRAIAAAYRVDHRVLASWLHHLSTVRNTCAHHSRLWNREFTVTPQVPRTKPADLAPCFAPTSRKVYNTLVILLYCMDLVAPQHRWRLRLRQLIRDHRIPVAAMGFPAGWSELAIFHDPARNGHALAPR